MEENKDQVVEQTTEDNVTKVSLKKQTNEDDSVIKVDLNKPKTKENEITDDNVDKTGVTEDVKSEDAGTSQEQKEVQPQAETQEEQPALEEVLEEVTDKVEEQVEELVEETKEAIAESEETGKSLPENVQKLVDFIEETGGDISDYVRLNQDYSQFDDMALLREYYKQTKKHLTDDEISFMMEDEFSYDEENDEERFVKKKKIALKEQVASAKAYLDGQKSKYYEEIKAGSRLTNEQQKAVNFFNRYNKESEENQKVVEQQTKTFKLKSDNLFNKNFKGFNYSVGEKSYRFNVKNTNEVKETQSDINNFVKKFLNKNNEMEDAAGYHKSLFTAMNADAVAKHFYEQGKADALKESIAKSKNVDMNPRQSFGEVQAGGLKVKVLSGDNSNDFKFKIKNNK